MASKDYDILGALADPVLIIDRNFSIVYANLAMGDLYQTDPSLVIGRKCYEFSHNSQSPCHCSQNEFSCSHREVFTTGQPAYLTHHHQMGNGEELVLEITTSPIRNSDGKIERIIQVMKDITERERLREECNDNQTRFECVFNSSPAKMAFLDHELRVIRLNRAMEKHTGFSSGSAAGRFCYDLWGQHCNDLTRKGRERICDVCQTVLVLQDGKERLFERKLNGKVIEIIAAPVRGENGRIIGVLEIGEDVTAAREATEALQESESRYRSLFEQSPVPLAVADFSGIKKCMDAMPETDGGIEEFLWIHPEKADQCLDYLRIIEVNSATLDMLKIPDQHTFWANLQTILNNIPLHKNPDGLVAIARGERVCSQELFIHDLAGKKLSTIINWVVEPGYEKSYGRVLLSLLDISERKATEEKMHLLLRRLQEAEENERRRLARDLHDEVGQKITVLGLNLHVLKNSSSNRDIASASRVLDDSLALLEAMASQLRSVMTGLRPVVLDDYGLAAALRLLAEDISARSGLLVKTRGEGEKLPIASEIALFRIAQEALTNVIKHAGAREVLISLYPEDQHVVLEIRDDGRGFDAEDDISHWEKGRIGLAGMRERADGIGGRIRIESVARHGSVIKVWVPK